MSIFTDFNCSSLNLDKVKQIFRDILFGKKTDGKTKTKSDYYSDYSSLKSGPRKIENDMTIKDIRIEISKLLEEKCKNIFSFINTDVLGSFVIETVFDVRNLNDVELVNKLRELFLDDGFKTKLDDIKTSIKFNLENTLETISLSERSRDIKTLNELFETREYTKVLKKMGLTKDDFKSATRKAPFYCIIICFLIIFNTEGTQAFSSLISSSDFKINYSEMLETFSKKVTLDARQNISVHRFTKFQEEGDKSCFLFHGVGTGKTMTSLSIALSNLKDQNITNAADHVPMKVLVLAPIGIFNASFLSDCNDLGIYTLNIIKKQIEGEFIESFEGLIRIDPSNPENTNEDTVPYYKIEFTGIDYNSLIKIGVEALTEKYNVFICDEAHNLLTNGKRLPLPKTGKYEYYDLDCSFIPNDIKIRYKKDETRGKNSVIVRNIIKDRRFLDFVAGIDQSIFLTGTPFQNSIADITDIAYFLNSPNINKSNKQNFINDVKASGGGPGIFFPFKTSFLDATFGQSWRGVIQQSLQLVIHVLGGAEVVARYVAGPYIPLTLGPTPERVGGTKELVIHANDLGANTANMDVYAKDISEIGSILTDEPSIKSLFELVKLEKISNLLKKIDPDDKIVTLNNIEGMIYAKIIMSIMLNEYKKKGLFKKSDWVEEDILTESDRLEELGGGIQHGGDPTTFRYIYNMFGNIQLLFFELLGAINPQAFDIANIEFSKILVLAINVFASSCVSHLISNLATLTASGVTVSAIVIQVAIITVKSLVKQVEAFFTDCCKIDYDKLVKHTNPYISVYNYDYNDHAIDTGTFYSEIKRENSIKTALNVNGNKSNFPIRYITQFAFALTDSQRQYISTAMNEDLEELKTSDHNDRLDLLHAQDKSIRRALSISCGCKETRNTDEDIIKKYIGYINSSGLKQKYDQYVREKRLRLNVQLQDSAAINVVDNFGVLVKESIELAFKKNLPGETDINKIIRHSVGELKKLDENETVLDETSNSANAGEHQRFYHILKLLKVIRCGLIYHDYGYRLHPHYRKNGNTYEYYLPLVYPSSNEVMYAFCDFLQKNNMNFIWMCTDIIGDAENNYDFSKAFKYGQYFTFPLNHDNNRTAPPICVVISPSNTEGFSFVYNPALLIPALCLTAGDQEQVHGRILRKYSSETPTKERYNKKIYQYFGGNEEDIENISTIKILYKLDENHDFAPVAKTKTEAKRTLLKPSNYYANVYIIRPAEQAWKNAVQEFYDLMPNSVLKNFAKHTIEDEGGEHGRGYGQEIQEDVMAVFLQRYKNWNVSEEFQLKTIYNISVLAKIYFNKIVETENELINNRIKPNDFSFVTTDENIKFCNNNNNPINSIICLKNGETWGDAGEDEPIDTGPNGNIGGRGSRLNVKFKQYKKGNFIPKKTSRKKKLIFTHKKISKKNIATRNMSKQNNRKKKRNTMKIKKFN